MIAMTYDWQGKRYARINKAMARRGYEIWGNTIYMVGCKLVPFSGMGGDAYSIKKTDIDAREYGWTFDSLVDNWQSYNSDYERGYYPSFWVRRV